MEKRNNRFGLGDILQIRWPFLTTYPSTPGWPLSKNSFTAMRENLHTVYTSSTYQIHSIVNSRFKKDLKLQIHLHEVFLSDDRFLGLLHKSFLNQTTLDLRKEMLTFLNQELFDLRNIYVSSLITGCPKNVCRWICKLRSFLNREFTVVLNHYLLQQV